MVPVAVVSLTMRRALLVTLAASVLTQSSENQRLREELKAANSRLSTLKSTLRAELTRVFALLDGDGGGWGPVRTPAARPGRITDNCSFGPCLGLAKSDGHSRNTHKHVQGLLPARHLPRCCATAGLSSEWMRQATEANKTLLRYFYPAGTRAADLAGERRNAAGALERPDGKPIQKAWCTLPGVQSRDLFLVSTLICYSSAVQLAADFARYPRIETRRCSWQTRPRDVASCPQPAIASTSRAPRSKIKTQVPGWTMVSYRRRIPARRRRIG